MKFPGVTMEAQSHLKIFKLPCAGNFHNVNQKHVEYRQVGSASKTDTSKSTNVDVHPSPLVWIQVVPQRYTLLLSF